VFPYGLFAHQGRLRPQTNSCAPCRANDVPNWRPPVLTNRKVAAALFISPKTVEANLSRIYRNLGGSGGWKVKLRSS
jgi:hypothetical protein